MIQKTPQTTTLVIERALAELAPLTPDAIAERMREAGIRAKRGCPTKCIMAVYLSRLAKTPIRVGFIFATDYQGGEKTKLPSSVSHFIGRFDVGMYPDLEGVSDG